MMIEDDSGERREGARGNEMLWRMEGVICHWNEANEGKKTIRLVGIAALYCGWKEIL